MTRPSFMRRPIAAPVLLAGLALASAGCGSSQPASLSGQVFVDGRPAPPGIPLAFVPIGAAEGARSPSAASTDESGRYEAMFTFREAGIATGEHLVRLTPGAGGGESMPRLGPDGKPLPGQGDAASLKFPAAYYQTITTVDVLPGSNEFDLELSSEGAADPG